MNAVGSSGGGATAGTKDPLGASLSINTDILEEVSVLVPNVGGRREYLCPVYLQFVSF